MRWFLNLSTSAKLYASFGLMVLLLAAVAATAYRSVAVILESSRALYEDEFTDVLEIKQIRANQIANRADMLSLMLPGERADSAALESAIRERAKRTEQGIDRLVKRNQADADSLARLQQFESLRQSSLQTRESETLPLIRAGKLEEARRLHLGVQAERDAQLDAIADEFLARTEQAARSALARSQQAARNAVRVFLTAGFIAVLLGVALTLLLDRVLSDPLKEVSAAAERVAAGDLGVRLPASSRADETGVLVQTFGRMVANLRDLTRNLSAEQRLLHNLMDSMPDAIFFKDRGHRFLRINRAHARLLGVQRPEDAVGRPTGDFFSPEEARQRDAEDVQVMLSGAPLPDKVRRITGPGGKVRWSSTTKAPIKDQNGEVTGLVGIARDVTDRVRLEEELRGREAGLRRAQLMAKLAHVITGPDGSFESWSETLPQLIGVDDARMPRSTREWLDLVHADDRDQFRDSAIAAAATGKRLEVGYRLRRADGEWIDVRQVSEPMQAEPDAQGRLRWFGTLQDITQHKLAEEKINRLNRVYAVLSGINGLIVRVRDRDELFRESCRIAVEAGKFRFAWIGAIDEGATQLEPVASHGSEQDFLVTVRKRLSLDESDSQERSLVAQAAFAKQAMISNDVANDPRVKFRDEHAARGIRSLAAFPLMASDKVAGVVALHAAEVGFFDDDELRLLTELAGDISFALEHIEKTERLDYLAYYDSITGLANRTLFRERLEQQLHESGRAHRRLAVIIVDIERFRTINDSFGRQAGDALLKQMAARFVHVAGDPAALARLGADHFGVLIPDVRVEQDMVRLIEAARSRILAEPFSVDGTELRIATKAGIALFPDDGADADALLRNAEAALRKAKASGEKHVFYTEKMTERVAEKLSLENKLRQALERGELVLHYQPKVDLEYRRIVGLEALIRWNSPELGLVPPMKFIPLMEETGLILEAGAWALRRAVHDHREWQQQGFGALRIAVNVSAIQLRMRDFVAVTREALNEGATPPGVDFEITESVIMDDIQATIEKLKAIRELGMSIAIDDFGTGYSSLAYLAKLPVETLKIDRSFVITMLEDADTATLVRTVISLAHSLKLKVVAEGVDSEEQAKVLRLFLCDHFQGYLFSKPLPHGELTALLRKQSLS